MFLHLFELVCTSSQTSIFEVNQYEIGFCFTDHCFEHCFNPVLLCLFLKNSDIFQQIQLELRPGVDNLIISNINRLLNGLFTLFTLRWSFPTVPGCSENFSFPWDMLVYQDCIQQDVLMHYLCLTWFNWQNKLCTGMTSGSQQIKTKFFFLIGPFFG
jgi:hypothetical protein